VPSALSPVEGKLWGRGNGCLGRDEHVGDREIEGRQPR